MKTIENMIDGTAVAYMLAYKCLMERNNEVCEFYQDGFSVYIFPAVIVAALSCEIAIKNHLNCTLHDHDLYKLFSSLSQEKRLKYTQSTVNLYNTRLKSLKKPDMFTVIDFKSELYNCKDTFTKCRYLYEGVSAVNPDFIEALMFAMNDAEDEYKEFLTEK